MDNFLFEDVMSNPDDIEICEDIERGERVKFYRGILARANFANQNKRVYPLSVMKEAIDFVTPLLAQKRLVGELDHPPSAKVNMERIALYIPRISLMEDGSVTGDVYPASTPFGNILRGLMSDGIKIGFSTRATGSVKPYVGNLGEGLVEVNKGMRMVAIDAVWSPSVNDAMPDIVSESVMLGQTQNFKKVWLEVFGK